MPQSPIPMGYKFQGKNIRKLARDNKINLGFKDEDGEQIWLTVDELKTKIENAQSEKALRKTFKTSRRTCNKSFYSKCAKQQQEGTLSEKDMEQLKTCLMRQLADMTPLSDLPECSGKAAESEECKNATNKAFYDRQSLCGLYGLQYNVRDDGVHTCEIDGNAQNLAGLVPVTARIVDAVATDKKVAKAFENLKEAHEKGTEKEKVKAAASVYETLTSHLPSIQTSAYIIVAAIALYLAYGIIFPTDNTVALGEAVADTANSTAVVAVAAQGMIEAYVKAKVSLAQIKVFSMVAAPLAKTVEGSMQLTAALGAYQLVTSEHFPVVVQKAQNIAYNIKTLIGDAIAWTWRDIVPMVKRWGWQFINGLPISQQLQIENSPSIGPLPRDMVNRTGRVTSGAVQTQTTTQVQKIALFVGRALGRIAWGAAMRL